MNAALDAGLTVFRTWGFHDQNSTEFDPNGLPSMVKEAGCDLPDVPP